MVVVFETIGAALLYFQWSGIHPIPERLLWDAAFHSVSSFCNAGFSTFTHNMAEPFVRSAFFSHWTVMILIVFGGLGFPVLRELWLGLLAWIRQKRDPTRDVPIRVPLSLHTRLVLSTTVVLLFGGTVLFLLSPSPFHGSLSDWQSYHEALFNSVTARTAGFNITDIAAYGTASTLILILLMFIGGSPAGTAGGIKTTTAAVAFFNLVRILKGRREVTLFRRRIPEETTTRAFAILLLSGVWIFVASFFVSLNQPELPTVDVLFETISSFATVGLSRGITASLSPLNQVIVAIGEEFESSLMVASHLQSMEVERILCREINEVHHRILRLMNIKDVIRPEALAARQLAKRLGIHRATRHFELEGDYAIVQIKLPPFLVGTLSVKPE